MRRNFGHDYFAAHVSGKTIEGGIPLLSMEQMWSVFGYKVREIVRGHVSLQVNACILMCNHYHVLCSSQVAQDQLISALESFSGTTFDDNNFVRPIDHYNDFTNTYRYIYRNPVEAGLVSRVEDYEFSSLYSLLGKSNAVFPVIDNMNLIFNPRKILRWLNSPEPSEIFGPMSLSSQMGRGGLRAT